MATNGVHEYSSETLATKTISIEIDVTEKYMKYMKDLDTEVDNQLDNVNGAIYGVVGTKLQKLWDENCSDLSSYSILFQNWTKKLDGINSTLGIAASDVVDEYSSGGTGSTGINGAVGGIGALAAGTGTGSTGVSEDGNVVLTTEEVVDAPDTLNTRLVDDGGNVVEVGDQIDTTISIADNNIDTVEVLDEPGMELPVQKGE